MELSLDEQTLLSIFRSLDHCDKKELLRHASLQQKMNETAIKRVTCPTGQRRLARGEERPERITEPIFTE